MIVYNFKIVEIGFSSCQVMIIGCRTSHSTKTVLFSANSFLSYFNKILARIKNLVSFLG